MSVTVDQILKLRVDPLTLDGDGTVANPLTVIGGTGGGGRVLQTVLAAGTTPLDFNDEAFDYWQIDLSTVSATTITATGALTSAVPMLTLHFMNLAGDTDVTFPASFKDASGNALGTVTFTMDGILPFYYANGEYVTNYTNLVTGGSGAVNLDDLGDVKIGKTTALTSGQLIGYDGVDFINVAAPSGGAGVWSEVTDSNGNDILRYNSRPIVVGATDAPASFTGSAYFGGGSIRVPSILQANDNDTAFGGSIDSLSQMFGSISAADATVNVVRSHGMGSWVLSGTGNIAINNTVGIGAGLFNNWTEVKETVALGEYAAAGEIASQGLADSKLNRSVVVGFGAGRNSWVPTGKETSSIYIGHWANGQGSSSAPSRTQFSYVDVIVIGNSGLPVDAPISGGASATTVGLAPEHDGQVLIGNPVLNSGFRANVTSYFQLPTPSAAEVPGQSGMPALVNGQVWYDAASNTFQGYQNGSIVTFTTS